MYSNIGEKLKKLAIFQMIIGSIGGIVAGVDYQVAPGLSLGVEIFPVMYQYTVMELHPSGMEPYWASNHHIKLLTAPRLKLGFTFGF